MLKTEQFRLVLYPERKKQLAYLAQREGRSQASLIDRLILEKYESLQTAEAKKNQSPSRRVPVNT